MPSTKTKTTRKRGKQTATKQTAKRQKQTTRKTTAKPKQPKKAPVTPLAERRTDADLKAAKLATTDMRENARGAGKRAPVNATQVALVRSAVGRRSVATVAKDFGFKSKAELARHARGELEQMPDGVSAKLAEFAQSLSGPGASKIRGRKLTAIVAHL